MTIALEGRIGDLFPKFLADAFILLSPFQTAGTVASGPLQALPNHGYHFLVFVQSYSHNNTSLPDSL